MEASFNNLPQMVAQLLEKVSKLESIVSTSGEVKPHEIIDTEELCTRLMISKPTLQRYRDKNIIPSFTIGSSIRYNYNKVIEALQEKNKGRRPRG